MALWSWPSGAPADERRALRTFTISPNWKGGILETLSWLTDVMSSEQAVEQRRGIRRWPRRMFEAGFLRQNAHRARLDNFLVGTGRELLMVPLWHEQFSLGTPRADGIIVFPSGTLATREFRQGDLVLLTNGDPDVFAVLTVAAINVAVDQIMLVGDGNAGLWPQGSRITPLRRARILDQMTQSAPADRVGQTQIRFQLMDADSGFKASWGYCSPLWRFKPDRKEALEFTYDRSAYTQDMDSGVIHITDPGQRAQITQSMKVKLFGREAVQTYRSFLYAARGKAARFYVPTFTADLHPVADLGGLTFETRMNGMNEYMRMPQDSRVLIGIVFTDGRPTIYRKIKSIAPVLGAQRQVGERYTVTLAIPPIRKQDIDRIMFIVPSRFDMDSFDILHVTDNAAVISSAVVTRSSILDGMPSLECFVTSKPFPVLAVETLGVTASFTAGVLYESNVSVVENLQPSARFPAGELRVMLQNNEFKPESVRTTASFSSGVLRMVLLSYNNYNPENVTVSAAFVAGTIRKLLITNNIPPESIRITASISTGTLS